MNITIKTIPHEEQNYSTVGNYFDIDDEKYILVSETGNDDYNFLISLHEFIEEHLTRRKGITEQIITKWDLEHPEAIEPGEVNGCPYFSEHQIATNVEKFLCDLMGYTWQEYTDALSKL